MKLSFEAALVYLKQDKTITREVWNGKMWIATNTVGGTQYYFLITPNKYTNSLDVKQLENINIEDIMANDWIAM
jgi:hypothetical protein